MKIVIGGGSGDVGAILARHFVQPQNEVIVLSRRAQEISGVRVVQWDGRTLGGWQSAIEGSDIVINLAGRSVNCRYNAENLKQMMDSRVESTRVIGQAIAHAANPPSVWLQSSTATIYAHRFDAPNDEYSGILGGDEPNAPPKWVASIEIAKAWEDALAHAQTPKTRKVAMRSAMTMSPDKGSVFDVLKGLARRGLGGRLGSGDQFISWIHEDDFVAAIEFIIERPELDGAINLAAPNPLPQAEFARILRKDLGASLGMPAPAWLIEIGTFFMRTESELVLKSRRVVPARLLDAGFQFKFPTWEEACADLVRRSA